MQQALPKSVQHVARFPRPLCPLIKDIRGNIRVLARVRPAEEGRGCVSVRGDCDITINVKPTRYVHYLTCLI